ncbi:hypothetical protein ADO05_01913 [Streptococcus parauberis]|nr:hypothetical protein ADO05_01913 [Streptococcus parauberis]POS68375.1 hypothetical protein AOS90_00055 [Streptococcus parauberis]
MQVILPPEQIKEIQAMITNLLENEISNFKTDSGLDILTKIHQLENGETISFAKDGNILFSDFYKQVWWDSYKAGQTTSTTKPSTQVTIDNTEIVFRKHIYQCTPITQ